MKRAMWLWDQETAKAFCKEEIEGLKGDIPEKLTGEMCGA